jgi:hypothetical protein
MEKAYMGEELGNLVDTDDGICECTLAARGLNIPERPEGRAHDMMGSI